MNPRLQRLKETNRLKAAKALEDKRHFDSKEAAFATQETILKAFRSLVSYLDNPQRITKTSIVNQLTDIGTPDALKVVEAIKDLHTTVKTHENTDLSEVANLLKGVLAEAKLIPKSHKDISIPDPIDNTKQLTSLEQAIKAVDKSIKAQKLVAEAPVINLPAPEVTVAAPDLKPIENEQSKTRKELVKALKALVFPATDTKPMEKELKKLNKLFNEFLDSVPASSGGGGGIVSYVNSDGIAQPVVQQADGSIPVTVVSGGGGGGLSYSKPTDEYDLIQDDDISSASYEYYGYMKSDNGWYIKRITLATNLREYVKGSSSYSAAWTNRASETYADYGSTF